MSTRFVLFLAATAVLAPSLAAAQPDAPKATGGKTRVACIGASITFGVGIPDRQKNSYPAQMQNFFGPEYDVRNLGISGTTMLKHGDSPYWNTIAYKEALAFDPDIVADTVRAGEVSAVPHPIAFEGEKILWHGFDCYDFLMDEETLSIKSADPKVKGEVTGQRRCIVVVPKAAALGNPWSWRGCYWDHEPQTEIELLRRGFHIAYITANATLKPDKKWDAWYTFLTEKHGLSKKPAFIGMSRGGEYAYTWGTANPDRVSCIYADNPGGNKEVFARIADLARNDVPLLHVCGSIDPILGRFALPIENIYHQFGGRITAMIKEGAGHHPHSLDPMRP